MTLYIQNPKDSTKKLKEIINKHIKLQGTKLTPKKSVAFLYVNNKLSGREIKERIPFSIASKRIKYLWLKLPKEAEIPVVQKV